MSDNSYHLSFEPPVDSPPQRVVSLVPSMTETLFELALGDRVVGVTDYCIYPEAEVVRLPKVGGTKNADVARVIDLKPDLVFANQEENSRADVEALEAAGIPVWVRTPTTVQETFNLMWDVMELFETTAMVPRVRLMEYTADWLRTLSGQWREEGLAPRVFVPIWRDPWMTVNAETYVHDLVSLCGGINVFAERERQYPLKADLGDAPPLPEDDPRVQGRDRRYPRVTVEEIVASQPDVVLLPSEPYAFAETDEAFFKTLDIPAAKSGRVHRVDGTLLTWHGTRTARAMDYLPNLLMPMDESQS